jgi:hypothetical protein
VKEVYKTMLTKFVLCDSYPKWYFLWLLYCRRTRTMRIDVERRERSLRIINMWTWFVSLLVVGDWWTGVLFVQVDDNLFKRTSSLHLALFSFASPINTSNLLLGFFDTLWTCVTEWYPAWFLSTIICHCQVFQSDLKFMWNSSILWLLFLFYIVGCLGMLHFNFSYLFRSNSTSDHNIFVALKSENISIWKLTYAWNPKNLFI